MRQSQKTEQQADRLSRIGLENRKYTRARSTGYGEGKGMSVTIQDLVLDRNNLNQAYLRVKRNKGAAGIDDMTVNDVHTGYKMLENTDLKLSVFQHFFILVSY